MNEIELGERGTRDGREGIGASLHLGLAFRSF